MASHGGFRDLAFGNRITYGAPGIYEAKVLDLPFAQASRGEYGTSDTRKTPTERQHPLELMQRIRKLGGLIGLGLGSGGTGVSWRDRVPLDCDASAKSFAQGLLYADELLDGRGIAIGTDISGFSPMPAPRFGVEACAGMRGDAVREAGGRLRAQALAQGHGVVYSTPVASTGTWRFARYGKGADAAYSQDEALAWQHAAEAKAAGKPLPGDTAAARLVAARWAAMEEGPNAPLERSRAGTREWDLNLDGFAHYGLLPDFLQDTANVLRSAGAEKALAPLFRSAELYLEMWEKIDARARAIRKSKTGTDR
jgi:hypothetical protein